MNPIDINMSWQLFPLCLFFVELKSQGYKWTRFLACQVWHGWKKKKSQGYVFHCVLGSHLHSRIPKTKCEPMKRVKQRNKVRVIQKEAAEGQSPT